MPKHTIPEPLVERIRSGRAILVAGTRIGSPSWQPLLEALTKRLASRKHDGDQAAGDQVTTLISRGRLDRALGFVWRTLGHDAASKVLDELWAPPDKVPEIAAALARLPFRQVWTTLPGNGPGQGPAALLETAMAAVKTDSWPPVQAITGAEMGEIKTDRRTLVKVLGDLDTYGVTAGADALATTLRHRYTGQNLILIGFLPDDPDLTVLLDGLARLERPAEKHLFVGTGLSPVDADALAHEYHLEVMDVAGNTGDAELVGFLKTLAGACAEAGIDLAEGQPDDDDLHGWLARWDREPDEARAALELMQEAAREANDTERLIDILVARVEHESDAQVRAGLLCELAEVFEGTGDAAQAFTALTTALHLAPANLAAVDAAERLAAETEGWAELVADVSAVAGEITDPGLAASYFARLGRWYADHLDHVDYAVTSWRQAVKHDPRAAEVYDRLAELLRKNQRWAELADVVDEHARVEEDSDKKLELYLALGDLYETQLGSTARAIYAYQAAAEVAADNDDALAALERLYRRDDLWDKLAEVLEARAAALDERDSQRAAALRRELAALRADKLGDVDGAIAKYEAASRADDSDVDAVRALVRLYEKTGRTAEYLGALERLIGAAPDGEKPPLLLRLAAEVEDKDPERAAECYRRIIAMDQVAGPAVDDAFRALERLLRGRGQWLELADTYERHLAAMGRTGGTGDKSEARGALSLALAEVYERELDDPHLAIAALLKVNDDSAARDKSRHREESLRALARLHQRIESWEQAVDALVACAELSGSATAWHEAGALITAHLDELGRDPWAGRAETFLEKTLELDPDHRDAMLALAALHRARSSWGNAAELLIRAEAHTRNRLERMDLLVQAADLVETRLDDPDRALELRKRVLELDPEHVAIGRKVSARLLDQQRWAEAVPVLQMLSRMAGDERERARRELALGRTHEALGAPRDAAEHYRRAVAADPGNLDADLGLAAMLYACAQETTNHDAGGEALAASWAAVDEQYRRVLEQYRSGLADSQAVDIWHNLGVAARVMGEDRKAYDAFARALEVEPHHRASLTAMVDVATTLGEFAAVVDAKRRLLDRLDSKDKLDLLVEIGGIYQRELADADAAMGAYLEALSIDPTAHVILHRVLELYTEKGDWAQAVRTLDVLAEHDASPVRRSKYFYTAALIAQDKLHDRDIAVAELDRVLDNAPDHDKAFANQLKLLKAAGDYQALAGAYRRMLRRVGEDAPDEVLLKLWGELGNICADKLGDIEAAIAALEVVVSLRPDDMVRHEELANLYLEAGEDHRADAISELQILLQENPDRVELYRALSELYGEVGEVDKAYCLAQALVFLRAATAAEKDVYARHRAEHLAVAERRITEELWAKSIVHDREDRYLGAIFAAVIGSLALAAAGSADDFGVTPDQRAEVGPKADRVVARVFKYVSDMLALDPEPHLFIREGGAGLRVVSTIADGVLQPLVLAENPHAESKDERALAFDVGRCLAYLRPERFIHYVFAGAPAMERALLAILHAAGAVSDEVRGDAARMSEHLQKTVDSAVLDRVRKLARRISGRSRAALITEWLAATELTANRVGLILAGDLETAAHLIATDTTAGAALTVKERLRDLLLYSVSEPYFAVRKHLRIAL